MSALRLVAGQCLELLHAVAAQIDLFVQADLLRLLASELDPQRVVLGRDEARERQNLAPGDDRLVNHEGLAVHPDAVAAGERGALSALCVFFKVHDIVEDRFDAGIGAPFSMFFHVNSPSEGWLLWAATSASRA